MNILTKSMIAAGVLAITGLQMNAQLSLGSDCGCPALASRTVVKLSTITTNTSTAAADAHSFSTGRTDLTCDKVYIIDDKIYVPSGAELWIEPGTVFKGTNDPLLSADALIVSRGGKIFANGTDCCPIIFTSAGNVPSSTSITDPLAGDPLDGSFGIGNRGHWGGLIILGNATNNLLAVDAGANTISDGVGGIEGLDPVESRNWYGGNDNEDSSGILRYVSIRHGGIAIAANNEINGLTMGSVGSGTTLEHIEVVSNGDDGVEFFGGTVDLKWASVMFCGDDGYDWDQGWSGRGQFWFSVENNSDKGWECDGDDGNAQKSFYSNPKIYNATVIGDGTGGDIALSMKEETQGTIANSIFSNHATGVSLNNDAADANGEGAVPFYNNGTLVIKNNIFENILTSLGAGGVTSAQILTNNVQSSAGVIDYAYTIDLNTNAVTDGYNPVPEVGTANITVSVSERAPNDGFFDQVNYKGAFKPGAAPWTGGYTIGALLEADASLVNCPTDVDSDGDTDVDDLLQLIGSYNSSCN